MIAIVEAGYTFASMADGGEFEWRISAANASLVDRGDRCCLATLDDGAKIALPTLLPSARYDAFMSDTLARVAGGLPPVAGIEDYARAMRLIDQIYEESRR